MRKLWMALVLMMVCCWSSVEAAQEDVSWGNLNPPAIETTVDESGETPAPVVNEGPRVRKMGDLTWRERRKMGLTLRNVMRVTKELGKAGELEGVSQSEVSAMVLDKIMGENPRAFNDPSIDFDALLDFIERLIPLIMRLIEMFGGLGDLTPISTTHMLAMVPPQTSLAA
jgi:hypothetical protein